MKKETKYEVKLKKLPKSEAELEVILPAELLEKAREKAIQHFSQSLKLPGFREGHVPEKVVIEKVGEADLLEEAADLLLKEHFPAIAIQENLDILGRPQIAITKLALGNPLEFKATFTVFPEFTLPDYKALAKKVVDKNKGRDEKIEVTDQEMADVLLQIRKNKAHYDYHKNHPEDHDHDHAGLDLDKEENLPALDDEFAKIAGNFQNLEELKAKVRENIIEEKKHREHEKQRAEIMEELVKNTELEIPNILVESELNKSLAQMKDDVARMGGNWEEYLTHTKKTEEKLREEFHDPAEKRAKIQIIFNRIAETEKIEPDSEVLENEVKQILEHYKEANPESARIYVATTLTNTAVLKLLENQS